MADDNNRSQLSVVCYLLGKLSVKNNFLVILTLSCWDTAKVIQSYIEFTELNNFYGEHGPIEKE